jgi:ankyrin repeat protein
LKHQAELPFTYVHWLMIEIMAVNKEYDSIEVTYEEAKLLTLNILPNCNTILHKCFHNLQLMRSLYEVVAESKSNFVIPFIKNMDGESPLHLAFNVRNLKAVEIFLDKIKNEPLDSHGRAVIEVLP